MSVFFLVDHEQQLNMKPPAISLILKYIDEAVSCSDEQLESVLQKYFVSDFKFHAGYPINDLHSLADIATKFWTPLKHAFSGLKRIEHITFDGTCAVDGKTWVACTGRYVGNFINPLFSIPANQTSAHLRFGEFYCIENGKIVEVYVLLEYLHLMRYAGVSLFPQTLGSDEDIPPPQTSDGLQYGDADSQVSQQSLALVMCMLAELLIDRKTSNQQRSYWADDMVWYGPAGIGTFRSLKSFALYRNAFLNTFPDRDYGNHHGVISKNHYVAVVGWKSVHATHQGTGWFGLAPTGKKIALRVMDFWRIDQDRIQENWVLIDIPHFFMQLGVDLFDSISYLYFKSPFEVPQSSGKSVIDDPQEEQFKQFLTKYNHQKWL